MAKYFKLDIIEGIKDGAGNDYAYLNEVKLWSGNTLISANELSVVGNSPLYDGDPNQTIDGISQTDATMCFFYADKVPGWIMYEYSGTAVIDGISITSTNSGFWFPTHFKVFEIESDTMPEISDLNWKDVVYVPADYSGTPCDLATLTESTDYNANTVHPFVYDYGPERKFYKLEILEGYLDYAYISELKLWNWDAQTQIPHQDITFISSSTPYREGGDLTVDGIQQAAETECMFYGDYLPAHLIYEYTGSDDIGGLSLSARSLDDQFGPTTFKFYELNTALEPLDSDSRWQQVLSVASVNDSDIAFDSGSKAENSTFADNTVHPFGSHVNLSAKTLLRNASGVTFTYSSGSFTQVNAGQPSEADFLNHGMSLMPYIPKDELMAWEPSGNFTVEYYDQVATTTTNKQLRLTSVPKAQIALPVNVIDITGVSELNGITVTQDLQFSGDTRFAISIDGTSWKSWSGTSWDDLNALSADLVSADYLMSNGMNVNVLNGLTWTELQQLYTGAPTGIAIAYAAESKLINDVAAIDRMELEINHEGEKWVRDHGQIELEISEADLVATPSIDCTFKVNYQDTAA